MAATALPRPVSPMQSAAKADRAAEHLGRRPGDRLQREFGRGAILGPAEMREQDDLGALVGQFGDGRRDALDAGGVGDLAVGDRNVEVDAHQHALAADVADIVECLEGGHAWFLSAGKSPGPYLASATMQDSGAFARREN